METVSFGLLRVLMFVKLKVSEYDNFSLVKMECIVGIKTILT